MSTTPHHREAAQRRRRVAALVSAGVAACVLAWIGTAALVVPALIKSAYRGDSFPAINAIIEGRDLFPVDHYLQAWNTFAWQLTGYGLLYLSIAVLMATAASSRAFFRKYVGEATPGALGAIRMLTCTALLVTTSWEDLASVALLPPEMRHGAGIMRVLPGLDRLLTSAAALGTLQTATTLLLFLGAIGGLTRIVIPLAAVAHFLVLGILIDYSFFWHQNLVPLYLLAVLSFTPCGDGWSVDRLWKLARGRDVPEGPAAVYGWSRYICWVVIALPYVQSGLSKLRIGGWSWWSATNMRGMLYVDSLAPREYGWNLSPYLVSAPDSVLTFLGVTTVVLEVFFLLVLFSRRARMVLPILMLMVHAGIFALQRILFFDLMLLQLVFIDFAGLRDALVRRAAARRRIEPVTRLGSDLPGPRAGGTLQYPLMASALVVVSIGCWIHRVEFYPLTAWHLYAMLDTSGTVSYRKVLGRYESGTVSPIRLEDGIGAMALDGRYTPMLDKCFGDSADVALCQKFLSASGTAYNARQAPGSRLTHFEIQTWHWDFVSSPLHPEQGRLLNRVIIDISPPPDSATRPAPVQRSSQLR